MPLVLDAPREGEPTIATHDARASCVLSRGLETMRFLIAVLLCLSSAACGGNYVVGVFSGKTTGCTPSDQDGKDVTVTVANAPESGKVDASVVTPLGLTNSGASSCQGSPTRL